MLMIPTMPIRWKLRAVLEDNAIKTVDLARAITERGGKTRPITLYGITGRGSPITPKGMDVLEDVILGLEKLTGKTFTPNDLIEVIRNG